MVETASIVMGIISKLKNIRNFAVQLYKYRFEDRVDEVNTVVDMYQMFRAILTVF